MPKVNTFGLDRPERTAHPHTIVDAQSNESFEFVLRERDAYDSHVAHEEAQRLIEKWVTGRNGEKPLQFVVGGKKKETVQPTEGMCNMAANIAVMQCPEDREDAYSAEELMAMAVTRPNAWLQLISLAGRVNTGTLPND